MLHVAVVGVGFGRRHLEALSKLPELVRVTTVCALEVDQARAAAEQYQIARWCGDYEEVLKDPTVDVVCLATPHHVHRNMTIAALERGKHVYCEKPAALTLAEAREMAEAAERAGRLVNIGYNMRYYEQYQMAKALIDAGAIGRIFLADVFAFANARSLGGFRLSRSMAGGGCLIDSGAHRLDLIRWLLGPYESVFARAGNYVVTQMEGEDTAVLSLRLRGEILATLTVSWGTHVPTWHEGMRLYGTEGTLEVWDHDLSLTLRRADGKVEVHKFLRTYEETLVEAWRDFAGAIEKGQRQSDTVKLLAVNQVLDAAYESMRTGKPVAIEAPV